MRNTLGTTNSEEPFEKDDLIQMFEEDFVVIKNYGRRGRVRAVNDTKVIDPFYWEFQGFQARRVKRNSE